MSLWDYRKNFAYDEPLGAGDALLVNLNDARGDYSRHRLLRELGLDVSAKRLRDVPSGKCLLFGGHRGCGKSTELRAMIAELSGHERFFVVELDALKTLDINNLNYADMALAMAEALARKVEQAGINVPEVFVKPLTDWFQQVIRSRIAETAISGDVKTGAEIKGGIPFLAQLVASVTASIRNNTTHKNEIRETVRNSFSTLADNFNRLLAYVEEEIRQAGKGAALIFVIDGTDRLRGDEADAFFIRDIHQLRFLRTNCILCAPISVLNEQGQIAQNYDAIFRLPMVKLAAKGDDQRIDVAWRRLREFVAKRLPLSEFDAPETLDLLIGHSGGHPRDLLRLINLCFQEIDNGPITRQVAETAMRRLGNEYKRLVKPDDFPLLVKIDRGSAAFTPATDDTRRLLYDLVLLEYNSYWWQTHPAVRALDAYRDALAAAQPPKNEPDAP